MINTKPTAGRAPTDRPGPDSSPDRGRARGAVKPDVATLDALLVTINGRQYRVERSDAAIYRFFRADDPLHFGYLVLPVLGTCECKDFQHRGGPSRPCKHLRALRRLRLAQVFRAVEYARAAARSLGPPLWTAAGGAQGMRRPAVL